MPSLADSAARVTARLSGAWPDAAASAVAAALAWMLAVWLFGHPHPVFAVVTAIVCLGPGLPDHGKLAVHQIVGVATGIIVGELALITPNEDPLLRVSLAAFFAILIASCYGLGAVVPVQSGVSAVLVLALGPATAGTTRLFDVAAGTAVGLLFSQVLMTPDPARLLDRAAAGLLARLHAAFRAAEAALETGEAARAQAAVEAFSASHRSLTALTAAIDTARLATRWSLRGRFHARQVLPDADRYERRGAALYATALLFGSALDVAMSRGTPAPPELLPRLRHMIALTGPEAGAPPDAPAAPRPHTAAGDWLAAQRHLEDAIEALAAFRALGEPAP
jgi:uncharacterized membrane protein YgaE (UPF0421/DUF939 family)